MWKKVAKGCLLQRVLLCHHLDVSFLLLESVHTTVSFWWTGSKGNPRSEKNDGD